MLALLLASLSVSAPPTETLPASEEARKAVERSLAYLVKSSTAWRVNRKCVTCHQIPFTLWPAHEASALGFSVPEKELDALTGWSLTFCTTNKHEGEFTGGFLATMVKMSLALEKAKPTEQRTKAYEFFVPLIGKNQLPDGSWKERNNIAVKGAEREGIEVDTMWTILGLDALERQAGKSLSPGARDTLVKMRQRGLDWLKDAKPATRSDWLALRALVERRSGAVQQAEAWRQELLKRQNPDGGWPFVKGGESHPLVTGEALYALGIMGTKGESAAVRRAWKYLTSTQEKDGSWKSQSRSALGKDGSKKVNEINIHWGTGWAAIGMLQTLPPPVSQAKPVRP